MQMFIGVVNVSVSFSSTLLVLSVISNIFVAMNNEHACEYSVLLSYVLLRVSLFISSL